MTRTNRSSRCGARSPVPAPGPIRSTTPRQSAHPGSVRCDGGGPAWSPVCWSWSAPPTPVASICGRAGTPIWSASCSPSPAATPNSPALVTRLRSEVDTLAAAERHRQCRPGRRARRDSGEGRSDPGVRAVGHGDARRRASSGGGERRRPGPAGRPPAGHPGRGQRAVARRRRGDDDPGSAGDRHHRDQVRRQHGGAARHPVRAAVRISAIGDPARLHAALADSEYIRIYQQYVDAFGLGYGNSLCPRSNFPAYEGSVDLQYATRVAREPVRRASRGQTAGASRERRMIACRVEDPGDRQLRLVRLQPRAVPGADRRRGRGLAQRRPAVRRSTISPTASTASCSRRDPAPPRRPASASTWSRARRASCRSSASASGCRRSVSRTAGWSIGPPSCCTARPRSIHHDGLGVLAGLPSRSRPPAITRWPSSPTTLPDVLEVTATTPERSDHGRTPSRAARRGGAVPSRSRC